MRWGSGVKRWESGVEVVCVGEGGGDGGERGERVVAAASVNDWVVSRIVEFHSFSPPEAARRGAMTVRDVIRRADAMRRWCKCGKEVSASRERDKASFLFAIEN